MKKAVENWVDIIREWQFEPYPPIRPLAEKIVKQISLAEKEMGKALRMKYMVAHAGGNGEGFNIAVNRFNQAINNYLERRK